MVLAAAGLAIGGAAGLGLGHVLQGPLFGVSAFDPWTYAAVAVVLGATAAAASYLPARRAARVDPAVALRAG